MLREQLGDRRLPWKGEKRSYASDQLDQCQAPAAITGAVERIVERDLGAARVSPSSSEPRSGPPPSRSGRHQRTAAEHAIDIDRDLGVLAENLGQLGLDRIDS